MPADKLHITLAGSEHVVEEGTTAGRALADRDPDSKPIAARVSGELRDLACPLADGDRVEPVFIDSADGLNILRHSTAHVLAQALVGAGCGASVASASIASRHRGTRA